MSARNARLSLSVIIGIYGIIGTLNSAISVNSAINIIKGCIGDIGTHGKNGGEETERGPKESRLCFRSMLPGKPGLRPWEAKDEGGKRWTLRPLLYEIIFFNINALQAFNFGSVEIYDVFGLAKMFNLFKINGLKMPFFRADFMRI